MKLNEKIIQVLATGNMSYEVDKEMGMKKDLLNMY